MWFMMYSGTHWIWGKGGRERCRGWLKGNLDIPLLDPTTAGIGRWGWDISCSASRVPFKAQLYPQYPTPYSLTTPPPLLLGKAHTDPQCILPPSRSPNRPKPTTRPTKNSPFITTTIPRSRSILRMVLRRFPPDHNPRWSSNGPHHACRSNVPTLASQITDWSLVFEYSRSWATWSFDCPGGGQVDFLVWDRGGL